MTCFTFISIKIFLEKGDFSDIRNAYLDEKYITAKIQMILSFIVMPISNAIGIYSVLEYIKNKKIRLSLIIYLIFLAETVIVTGARGGIIYFAAIAILGILDKYKNNVLQMIKENKKLMLFLIIGFLVILAVTLQRNLAGRGFIYNVYTYFVGSIHLLGRYLANPQEYLLTPEYCLYGQIIISAFTYPFIFIMRRFGLDIRARYIYCRRYNTKIYSNFS